MYRSLLVPLDGSPFGEQALPIALSVARRAGATLELAHVHTPFEYYQRESALGGCDPDVRARQDKQAYLDGIVQRLAAEGKVTATSTLLIGHASEGLHDHAVARKVDLVVMTTHGRGPFSRFWLGSVADDLMRRLPMPVLLVRPQEPAPDAGQEPVFRRLLIPLDGSELAEQILEPAVVLGALMQAEYTLLRVIEPLLEFEDDAPFGSRTRLFSASSYTETAVMRKRHHAEAQGYLEKVANRLRSQSLPIRVRVVQDLHSPAAILNEAQNHNYDLIALATRGLGGLSHLVLGSVADKVVRGATTPVLVYRPRNK